MVKAIEHFQPASVWNRTPYWKIVHLKSAGTLVLRNRFSAVARIQALFFSAYRRISAYFTQIFEPPQISTNLWSKLTSM